MESLKLRFPKTLIRIIDMDSESWRNATEKPDWLILGNLKNFVWKKEADKMLIFPQRDRAIQTQIDHKLGMKSYAIEALPRELSFSVMNTEDKSLYTVPWQVYRYMQLRQEDGEKIALSDDEVLLFEKDNIYFSAFDFSKYDFSGVTHPYFPVFLYQLFLNRFPDIEVSPVVNDKSFERPSSLQVKGEGRIKNIAEWSDFSKVLLFLFFIWLLLEIYLIQNIQKLTNLHSN